MQTQPAAGPFLLLFPFAFVGMWLAVTTMLSLLSGWFQLAERYPDRNEEALVRLRSQSGSMGLGVSMGGILKLSACPSGLRVAILRVFGPFSRPFFVPWAEINTIPKTTFFIRRVRLGFGRPEVGVLTVEAWAWERLSQRALADGDAIQRKLSSVGNGELIRTCFIQWLLATVFASAFFYFIPRFQLSNSLPIPAAVCIGFPAVAFGISQIIRYLRHRQTRT